MKLPMSCPKCGEDLKGDEIPTLARKYYDNNENFTQAYGIFDKNNEVITSWECPICGHKWSAKESETKEGD